MKTQNKILSNEKSNNKLRQKFSKQIFFKGVFVLLLSMLLSCNSDKKDSKNETTIIDNAYSKNGDIDNDGILNEFDIDFIPKQTTESVQKQEEIIVVKDTLVKQTLEVEKPKKRYAAKQKQKKTKNKIPKAPISFTLKRDIELLAVGKKRLAEVSKNFCNTNQKIIVNGKSKTFARFYRDIKGKKIKIKKFDIKLNNSDCVRDVVLKYDVIFSFNIRKKNRPYKIAKSKNRIIGF